MQNELTLVFDGTLAPNHMISVRTISHTLPHLQRAIDKLVMYDRYGVVMKGASLTHTLYDEADLYLSFIEKGSIKIPLLSDLLESVPKNLNAFLANPYDKAASELELKLTPIPQQLGNIKANVSLDNVKHLTHEELIEDQTQAQKKHVAVAVLRDLSDMLSPLRAASSKNDTISLNNNVSGQSRQFLFDQQKSKNFAKIITQKQLASPAIYTGKLIGLEETKNKNFPYAGTFRSEANGQEMKLLIGTTMDVDLLKPHNLSKKSITIWASPLTTYHAFDEHRGDIVFVSIVS